MFTQDCYIKKNTPELREYLKMLGYDVCSCCDDDLGWIFTIEGKVHSVDTEEQPVFLKETEEGKSDNIECENETQFKAIAALRDDIDNNQWFVVNNEWYLTSFNVLPEILRKFFHKATVEELIEHFKNK